MGHLKRRIVSVPGLVAIGVLLVVLMPLWLPIVLLVDAVRLRLRFPIARLLTFGIVWAWTEIIGLGKALWFTVTGRRHNKDVHWQLQRWWSNKLMRSMGAVLGVPIDVQNADVLSPGPTIMLCRHASLADSALSCWVVTNHGQLDPHYVLKNDLLADPCLDIVGHRIPNHFLDRNAKDGEAELASLRRLTQGMGVRNIGVIYPEGTRASAKKRARALEKIGEADPGRAARLAGLQHVIPPRPGGAQAMLEGCPEADVVIAWHVGFDGMDTFGGILDKIGRKTPQPIRFRARRVPRAEVPSGDAFITWLDDTWVQMDRDVAALLQER